MSDEDEEMSVSDQFFRLHLARVPVIAILRGLPADVTVSTAQACWDAGIELVEVPAQGDSGWRALDAAAEAARERGRLIGAGTICSAADAARAVQAGAAFLVSPGLDEATVNYAALNRVSYLPGVTTPTEVQRALALNAQNLKIFPAGPLGVDWITALRRPFPAANFIAVGGVSAANAQKFIRAGAIGVGVGGALTNRESVRALASLKPPHESDAADGSTFFDDRKRIDDQKGSLH
ncbi:bifunctional 4-hydroxy-2-oxoglutarate aldolase/2-dehydro-3-deoxy-phosphogluconate aldolase [Amycolatopsis palatopharyngis]|uniref:bifunctional 4-hydroxy-2-oxoglutarate aldolase/2-dehydro-3-deoxy-phosphogluconate aldolase n=1 Tax=Amycolatopsis palatopharyngis TaxID=187982 RepID=UPI001B885B13|nr:bifunctional 4-hydroxy-2-oxoglutarate aldolase/2-dehydro-3-deoxy-phosphogluconate aldolase [Amycolatopsis palatopharyngis]